MQERKRKMMITLISSVLAFAAGFVVLIYYLIHCSEKKWKNFKNDVNKARIKNGRTF